MKILTIISLVFLITIILVGFVVRKLYHLPPLPEIKVQYWGKGPERPDDTSIRPFTVNISDSELKSFQNKLLRTSPLTPPLEGVGFEYGFNTKHLNKIIQFWKDKYDWRDREKYFNSLPQYTTQIGGLKIHFLHVKPDPVESKGKKVLPLLMLHGWPGSVLEFYNIIPLLTTPKKDQDFVFEVIVPSLPGFGFSEGAAKPGLGAVHISFIFNELMTRLKHDQYYIQGGDFGSAIGYDISLYFPKRILGFHCNYCLTTTTSSRLKALASYLFPSLFVEEHRQAEYKDQFPGTVLLEFGFFHIQATKPDSIGVALGDSPAGLAAYILEKYSTWTNKAFRSLGDGGLDLYNKVELLDQVMLYWFSNSITTSMRLYSETVNRKYQGMQIEKHVINVPIACVRMPNELLYFPKMVYEGTFPNVVLSDLEKGGHFAAFEVPQLLSENIWNYIGSLRGKEDNKEKMEKNQPNEL